VKNVDIIVQFPGCPHIVTADRDYAEVKKSYLLGAYYSWFKNFLYGGGNDPTIVWDATFDCDDFARLFCALLQLAHFRNKRTNEEGVAVGEIHYMQDTGGGHAIVCAFTDEGRIFIEPQTGLEMKLSNNEIASIFLARF
jgi:hypothetical protein